MKTESLKPSLPPYHFSQRLRCVIRSTAVPDEDSLGTVNYRVDIPGDKRQGVLKSFNASLQVETEVDAIFISHCGRTLGLQEFRETGHQHTPSDEEMRWMSMPIQGSLVSVEVSEKSGEHYKAVYKDYWGDTFTGSLISSRKLVVGEVLDVAVSGWSASDMSFVSVEDVEKEMTRQKDRSEFLLAGTEVPQKELALDLDWMGAVTNLTHVDDESSTFKSMIDEAEVLIEKIQNEGLKKYWNETVEALKMYAYPNETPEISSMLQQFVEKYSEKEVIEFLSFRLHPNKECPLTPISRDILQSLSASFRSLHPDI